MIFMKFHKYSVRSKIRLMRPIFPRVSGIYELSRFELWRISMSFTITLVYKEVNITRKCHNYRPQTNPRHHEIETQNTDTHTTTLISTHLSPMEFRLLSVGSVNIRFKGCWVCFFLIFIQFSL